MRLSAGVRYPEFGAIPTAYGAEFGRWCGSAINAMWRDQMQDAWCEGCRACRMSCRTCTTGTFEREQRDRRFAADGECCDRCVTDAQDRRPSAVEKRV